MREGKFYEIPLITWDITFKSEESKVVTCEYELDWLLDPGLESLLFDLSDMYLWAGQVDSAYIQIGLPNELLNIIASKNNKQWPKITVYPTKFKIKKDSIAWSFKKPKLHGVNSISVKIDNRKPGLGGD